MNRKRKHHWGFRLWKRLRGLLALLVVFAGLLVGLVSLLLPFEQLYQQRLLDFLERQWQVSVAVDDIEGSWQGYGPHFQLKGLRVQGQQKINIAETALAINVYQFLIPGGKTGIDLQIGRADLSMIDSPKGPSITINDDQKEQQFTELIDRILSAGTLEVQSLAVNLVDDQGQELISDLNVGFRLEQDETHRAMSLLLTHLEGYMRINSMGLKDDELSKDARWHLVLSDFDVASINDFQNDVLIPSILFNGEVWVTSEQGVITDAVATLEWQAGDASGDLNWHHEGENQQWQSLFSFKNIVLAGLPQPDLNAQLIRDEQTLQWAADHISLSWLAHGLSTYGSMDIMANGQLSQLSGQYDWVNERFIHADAQFDLKNFHWNEQSVFNLQGQVAWLKDRFNVKVTGQDGLLSLPQVFRGKMAWHDLVMQLSIKDWDPLDLNVNQFWCDCKDFNADGQIKLWQEDAVPQMQFQAKVTDVDVSALHGYWPNNVWKPPVIKWLDESLISGVVDKGYLFQQGALVKEAFADGKAAFASRAYLNDLTVKFNPEWPAATDLSGVALFTGNAFAVSVDHAHAQGVEVTAAEVEMASYKQNHLAVSVAAKAKDSQMLDYLDQTPITKAVPLDDKLSMTGPHWLYLDMDVPIVAGQTMKPKGRIHFDQAGLETEHMTLSNLTGDVQLDGFDLIPQSLHAQLYDQAIQIEGVISTQGASGLSMDLNLFGPIEVAALMRSQGVDLPIEGVADWNLGIVNKDEQLRMIMKSDLVGTEIALPAPLNKAKATTQPFELSCLIPCKDTVLTMVYGDDLQAKINLDAGGWQLDQLHFGRAIRTSDNQPVGGRIKQLDIDNWLKWIKAGPESSADSVSWQLPITAFTLQVDDLLFLARHFKDVAISVSRESDGYRVSIDNEDMKGVLVIPDDLAVKGVVAEFEYLHWKEATVADLSESTQDVEKMPDLHIFAQEFSYLGVPLGQLRLEMRNVIDGMKVDQMSLHSEVSNIQISGRWDAPKQGEAGLGHSDFDIVMTSEKMAEFLQSMSFDAPISNTQTLVKLDAQWPGTPSMFDLKTIKGTLQLTMGEGEVLDTKPGFGRVVGLLSLTNLPRRLLLDFKDVVADGLHFKSMEGRFSLADGKAVTEDFMIRAAAVKVKVRGATNFAEQSYDQIIVVEPQVGKTLPTIGAIAGGAVGAAAGFFIQGIFNKQLKKSNRITYQVKGTWDQPEVTVIEDE